ncbi:integral membrane protein [Purpureocillium lilacinum]|uniref:Integral membrane protein n=1 Tax=Purpureocillium lilacinum TaxID=33203 RepID=A0A179HIT4_PURLI|nr:integral membrane protein [Purpureocillium lilacinum]OAQ89548.1 integral membrane protein [Purpureocillium lilacinum]
MAHLAPPPPNINLQETKRPRMVAVFAGTWALGVLATLLRLYCRRLTKSRLWLDDWLIIISLFFSAAFMFDVTVWMASHGFGRHVWVGPPDALEVWAKGLFMAVFTYTLSLVFIKWSILAWYWRLFHIQSYMKPLIWILFAVVCIWGVAKIIVVSLECFPIEAIWEVFDPDNPLDPSEYHCGVDIHKFFLGNAIPNIITDIFIMVLPLPYILKLHLRVSQKVALFGIFVVGTFVTIVSAIRLVFVVGLDLHSPDKTWNQAEEMMWTGVEVNIATVCANLLTLRPILNLILHGTVYVESQQHSEALNVHIEGLDPRRESGTASSVEEGLNVQYTAFCN